jgi:hypothetical protein
MKKDGMSKMGKESKYKAEDIRKQASKAKVCTLYAPNDDVNVYDNYVEGLLSVSEKMKFEKHMETCLCCSSQMVQALRREEMAEHSYLLSEVGQKRSLIKTIARMHAIYSDSRGHNNLLAVAAEGKTPRGKCMSGTAFGVAVHLGSDAGVILECTAIVSDNDRGEFEILAQELELQKENNLEFRVSSPLNLMKERLTALFKNNPSLQAFNLLDKMINVDVTSKGDDVPYIFDSESLALTVLVAILAAVTGKPIAHDISFSAGIKINGLLEDVGHIQQKISIAEKHGMNHFFIAEENRPDCVTRKKKKSGINLRFFSSVDEVIEHLGFTERLAEQDADNYSSGIKTKGKKGAKRDKQAKRRTGHAIADAISTKDIRGDIFRALDAMASAYFERAQSYKPLNATFILGDPELITKVLTPANVAPRKPLSLLSLDKGFIELASIVDGTNLGFLIDQEGFCHTVLNLNMEAEPYAVNKLLQGIYRHFAIISKITGAVIYSITSAAHRVKVFDDGKLIARYRDGKWEMTDYDQFVVQLNKIAQQQNIPADVLEKVCRVAMRMADLHEKGIFVFGGKAPGIRKSSADKRAQLPFTFQREYIGNLSDELLINFAKEDGAVVLDGLGKIKSFMDYRGCGAQEVSERTSLLTVAVNQDGSIVIYSRGDQCFQL